MEALGLVIARQVQCLDFWGGLIAGEIGLKELETLIHDLALRGVMYDRKYHRQNA